MSAHEYLGGVGVVPQKADEGTDHGADKDDKFLRTGYVHNVEITGIFYVAGNVSQYAQCDADDG